MPTALQTMYPWENLQSLLTNLRRIPGFANVGSLEVVTLEQIPDDKISKILIKSEGYSPSLYLAGIGRRVGQHIKLTGYYRGECTYKDERTGVVFFEPMEIEGFDVVRQDVLVKTTPENSTFYIATEGLTMDDFEEQEK